LDATVSYLQLISEKIRERKSPGLIVLRLFSVLSISLVHFVAIQERLHVYMFLCFRKRRAQRRSPIPIVVLDLDEAENARKGINFSVFL